MTSNSDGVTVNRRQVVKGIGSAVVGLAGIPVVASTDQSSGPYYTKLKSVSTRGYAGGVSRTFGAQTPRFLAPSLELTPKTVKSKRFQGVAVGQHRGWIDPLADVSEHTYVVTHEDGKRRDSGTIEPATFEVPDIDEDEYDEPVLGYRIVGDVYWGPAAEDVPIETAATDSPNMEPFPEGDGPAPTRLEYELFRESEPLHVDRSYNCFPNNDLTNLLEEPRHRIVSAVEPGAYYFDIDCSPSPAWFDIIFDIEVVLDSPRPKYGNENGFAFSSEESFEAHKMTRIEDLAGYTLISEVRASGVGPHEKVWASLEELDYGLYNSGSNCPRPVSIGTGNEGVRWDGLFPWSYLWAVRPESGVEEWEIKTTIYKQVQPDEGGYTHPAREPPKAPVFR